ncbi:hypothetical protein [Miltoncostaea oceani]|uniref:hypothetical protein n=1 Tax=Miltoncostaea oceani TaxID=2843216 RepID=UPI001C3DE33B|nr:hypothetical protein [Miltoncostaea oceani]
MARNAAVAAVALALTAAPALAAPGDLDPSFDGDGRLLIDFDGSGNDAAWDVAVQPDGRIVLAGSGGSGGDFTVARLLGNGAGDPAFDGDGKAVVDLGGNELAFGVGLRPGGGVALAGVTQSGGVDDTAVAALTAGGTPDASFDGDGRRSLDAGGADEARAVLVQPDGKIVIAVQSPAGNADVVVIRLLPGGAPDPGFDGDGTAVIGFGGTDRPEALALQPDGRILVAGSTSSGDDMVVARLREDGAIDTSFDFDGRKEIDAGGAAFASAVALQPDGKVVVAGTVDPGDMVVARLRADGSFDPGFAGDGTTRIDAGGDESGDGVAVQQNGRIVVAGSTSADDDIVVARLNGDGTPDGSFGGGDGRASIDFGGAEQATGVALQPDGGIVVSGLTLGVARMLVARVQGDPPPVPAPPPPATPAAAPPPGGLTLTAARFAPRWRVSRLSGVLTIQGRAERAARLQAEVLRANGAGGALLSRSVTVTKAGAFTARVPLPPRLLPGRYLVRVRDVGPAAPRLATRERLATLVAPREGVVLRAVMSTTPGGRQRVAVPRGPSLIFASFRFATLPRRGQPIVVSWYQSGNRVAKAIKVRGRSVASFLGRVGSPLGTGRYRAELTVGGTLVAVARTRIR